MRTRLITGIVNDFHAHGQSTVLVSSKALWLRLGLASRVAGLGVFYLMAVDCSIGCPVSDAGQADALGFHCPNGHPFACHLLLERRSDWKTMEQRGRQETTSELTAHCRTKTARELFRDQVPSTGVASHV